MENCFFFFWIFESLERVFSRGNKKLFHPLCYGRWGEGSGAPQHEKISPTIKENFITFNKESKKSESRVVMQWPERCNSPEFTIEQLLD